MFHNIRIYTQRSYANWNKSNGANAAGSLEFVPGAAPPLVVAFTGNPSSDVQIEGRLTSPVHTMKVSDQTKRQMGINRVPITSSVSAPMFCLLHHGPSPSCACLKEMTQKGM